MTQIYYKVVREDMESMVKLPDDFKVTYKIGEWVEPKVKNTKLFVFDSFQMAAEFISSHNTYRAIYECEVKNPGKPKFLGQIWDINSFWKLKWLKKNLYGVRKKAPTGTISCDSVKLIKLVHQHNSHLIGNL